MDVDRFNVDKFRVRSKPIVSSIAFWLVDGCIGGGRFLCLVGCNYFN